MMSAFLFEGRHTLMNYVIKVVKVILQVHRTHLLTFYRSDGENSVSRACSEPEQQVHRFLPTGGARPWAGERER